MKRINLKWCFLLITLLALISCDSAQKVKRPENPNVLFIMCDDLNDYQGVFGGHPQAKTPNIDKLAASGVQFLNAQTNVPVCQPSRNSLFTGVYPHQSNDFGWTKRTKQPVLKHNKTLMTLFRENGYYLLGSGKLLHGNEINLWDEWGMNEKHNYGPFVFDGTENSVHSCVPEPYRSIGPVDGSFGPLSATEKWSYGWDKKPFRYVSDSDRDLMQDELHAKWASEKIKELEQNDGDQPFFMGIGFVNPHTPLHAPQRFFDMFPLEEIELDDWLLNDAEDAFLKNNIPSKNKGFRYYRTLLESYNGDREVALKHFLQAYLACVAFVDEQIGKVVDAVDNSDFKDNTLILLTSDHGWQMGEKDYLFKNSPWEESARVPLVIRTPEMNEGRKEVQPVSLIDVFPTLVDYCSLTGDNKVNDKGGDLGGFSMVPLLDNSKKTKWEGPEGALTIVGNIGPTTTVDEQHYSYRTEKWRYIRYANGEEELYNHNEDPYEWENLAMDPKYVKTRENLKTQMDKIINQ